MKTGRVVSDLIGQVDGRKLGVEQCKTSATNSLLDNMKPWVSKVKKVVKSEHKEE